MKSVFSFIILRGEFVLAEIKGKVSRTGSNLSERLEDNLTGNVFGALRYIPFIDGLGKVLANAVQELPDTVNLPDINSCIDHIKAQYWADVIEFWPYDKEGELDALLTFEDTMIGIEVKYLSGLSSVDETGVIPTERSKHQLARESSIISRKGNQKNKKNKILLFIADRQMCNDVMKRIEKSSIASGVTLGFISWQDFLHELKQLNGLDQFQQIIIQDLIELLTRKGFEDFIDMKVSNASFVNSDEYFNFVISNQVEISFTTNPLINKELYYEFNR